MAAEFSYRVNLGNPVRGRLLPQRGVLQYREGLRAGRVQLCWTGYHAFYMVTADLHAFADGPQGRTVVDLANGWGGGFDLSALPS